ncbi:MAG: hypothetical protein AAF907_17760, partial [Planctomycetota bacterium]
KMRFPEVDQEIARRVGREFRAAGVDVASADRVLDWVEERGGVWDEDLLGPIADEFEVDYIVVVELEAFDWRPAHSPDLLQGSSSGWIRTYAAGEKGQPVGDVMNGEFESVYPQHHPESALTVDEKIFRERYLDRLCNEASRRFIPFHQRDTI